MTNERFALGRDQRHEILKAVRAIERQLESMSTRPQWQALYVISTNLAIIQANALDLPRASST